MINGIHKSPKANITNGEELNCLPPKIRNKLRMSTLKSLLYHTLLEILPSVIRQEKEIKGIQIRKGEIKLTLFVDDMIVWRI